MRRVAKLVTAAAKTPVTLAEVKAHCRVTFSDDDTALGIYLASAVATAEQFLQRKLITQTWKMFLDCWPSQITTLYGDLQSVTHVKYTDIDGTTATMSNTLYDVDINSVPGRIVLKYGQSWPSATLNSVNPIEVQFVTGYGAETANVPEDIRNALLILTAHFYENREQYLVSASGSFSVTEIPFSVKTLLSPYRVWEWIL